MYITLIYSYLNFRHNEELANAIVRLGALEHIVTCLEDFDTQVTII